MEHAFDVALSFAGEDRITAEALASELKNRGLRVFYDLDYQAELWGKDLYQYLSELYQTKARFCIVLISQHYAKKDWTRLELSSAQSRGFAERVEYLLPVRIDDTALPGLLRTVGYLDFRKDPIERIADHALAKVRSAQGSLGGGSLQEMTEVASPTAVPNRLPPRLLDQLDALANAVHARQSLNEALSRAKRLADVLGMRKYSKIFDMHLLGRIGFVDPPHEENGKPDPEIFMAHVAVTEDRAMEPLVPYNIDPEKFLQRSIHVKMTTHVPSELQQLIASPERNKTVELIAAISHLEHVVARIWKRLDDFVGECDRRVHAS